MKRTFKKLIAVALAMLLLTSVFVLPAYAATTLSQVKGLRVTETDSDEIELKWSGVSKATGYQVYMKVSNGKWQMVKTAKKTSCDIENLKSATEYSFKVRAYKTGSNSKKTYGSFSEAAVTSTQPGEVKNLSIKKTSKTKAALSWNKVSRADGYRVYKYNVSSKKWEKLMDVSKTSASVTVTEKGGEKFRVRAYKKLGNKYYFGDHSAAVTNAAAANNTVNGKISYNDAKSIALKDAGLKAGDVKNYEVELEKKGNKSYYDIEFESGKYEYEYEIDAQSGKIVSKEKERK